MLAIVVKFFFVFSEFVSVLFLSACYTFFSMGHVA